MSLPVWIGLRYLRSKKRTRLVSFVNVATIVGITLGVMTLIIVLSVMNGFQKEIRGLMLSFFPHVEVRYILPEESANWTQLADKLKQNNQIAAAAPYVEGQALIANAGEVGGVQLKGVDPALEDSVAGLEKYMINQGRFSDLKPDEFDIILGSQLAYKLSAKIGGKISVFTPEGNVTPVGMVPRVKQFNVVGIVQTKSDQVDANLALIHLQDAQKLYRLGDEVSGIRLKLFDPQNVERIRPSILTPEQQDYYLLSDWTDYNQTYFEAVRMEKRMMSIVLMLIVLVATVNLISSLITIVTEKQADIAILRTQGFSPTGIMKIFITQGLFSGFVGTTLGVILGCLISWKIGLIVKFFEGLFGVNLIQQQVYFIDYLPSDIHLNEVVIIAIVSLVLSFLATLYPSYSAAKTQPAEALRYE